MRRSKVAAALVCLAAVTCLAQQPYPAELPPLLPPPEARTSVPKALQENLVVPAPVEITIAQFFTPSALQANGGLQGSIAFTNRLVTALNLAWSRSLTTAHLTARVVTVQDIRDVMAWPTTESGSIVADLDKFASEGTYSKTALYALRGTLAADLMVILSQSNNACGVSYLGPSAELAYSAVSAPCAEGNWSWAHELGHLFGLMHNSGDTPAPVCGPTAVGYGTTPFRTIMSYAGGPRTGYFSDPDTLHAVYGVPVGTSQTRAVACLALTASTVAAFRLDSDPVMLPSFNGVVQ